MRPPYCGICDKHLDANEGGLVYFKKRRSDIAWIERMEKIHGVGHPPYCDWFCEKHIKRAQELEHLTIDKALTRIREEEKQKQ